MLTLTLNSKNKQPLYEQIYNGIKHEICTELLKPGDKLPSSRAQASFLGVSRNTVEIAYEQLVCEGYLEARPRRGYFVSHITHTQTFSTLSSPPTDSVEQTSPKENILFDFSPDAVDLSRFPYTLWNRLLKNIQNNSELFLLGKNQGDSSLRRAIAAYLHGSRGVNCDPDSILVGAGMDYLLQLLCVILGRGNKIAMENPGYQQASRILTNAGETVIYIPLDENGICMTSLKSSNSDIVYVTPSHQYPLGSIMPITRKHELLSWAERKTNRYIIEDDHDSEFRYKGKPIPALQGIDTTKENVIYIGSFSKSIAPSIRIGYMVLPKPLLSLYKQNYAFYACTVSRMDQAVIAEFINEGHFEKYLNRMRKVYKNKHDFVLDFLKTHAPNYKISGENAGLYVVLTKKSSLPVDAAKFEDKLCQLALKNGIRLAALSEYYSSLPKDYHPGFLLGFAHMTEENLEKGLTLLCEKILS